MIDLTNPNTIQKVALPLEVIGLSLAYLEIRYRVPAQAIDRVLHKLTEWPDRLSQFFFNRKMPRYIWGMPWPVTVIPAFALMCYWNYLIADWIGGMLDIQWTTVAVGMGVMTLAILFVGNKRKTRLWKVTSGVAMMLSGGALSFILLLLSLFLLVLAWVLKILAWIGRGYTIGGFGLLLAFCALVGEAIQVGFINRKEPAEVVIAYWTKMAVLMTVMVGLWILIHRKSKDLLED